jgi:hypothetical protein
MTAVVEEIPQPELQEDVEESQGWLVFEYSPVSLFSLKSSRATSTAGKTLLTPTPYAVKMAFLDAALRHGLTKDPERLVRWLAKAILRIGVPDHACVTGTIQRVRQEARAAGEASPYRTTIAMREFVHYSGVLRLAFDLKTCADDFIALLLETAPSINYLGKRGSFVQYIHGARRPDLGAGFTEPVEDRREVQAGQRVIMDDFGTKASFSALNSFSQTELRRSKDRRFVETVVPLTVYSSGPAFVHYTGAK